MTVSSISTAALPPGLDDHPGDARVDRQPRHLAAGLGQLVGLHGVELLEEPDAVNRALAELFSAVAQRSWMSHRKTSISA